MTSLRTNETVAQEYINCMIEMSEAYSTDNVLVTWGYDFCYYDANNTFGLIDDIIEFLQEKKVNLNLVYSTVENFTKSV